MTGSLLIAVLIVLLWRFPDALISRIVNRTICLPLAQMLIKVERRHILFAVMMVAVMIFAGDLVGMLGPLDAGFILLFDLATYIDILMIASLTAIGAGAVTGCRAVQGSVQRIMLGVRRMPRARSRRTRSERHDPAANDDDRPDRIALAA